jgi:hypothetical protein
VPLSNFVPRGFGFVHHSIAILYHEVPNLSITIRNFFIAVLRYEQRVGGETGYERTSGACSGYICAGSACLVTFTYGALGCGKPPPSKQTSGGGDALLSPETALTNPGHHHSPWA